MGIENRDYYRQSHASGAWGDWGVYGMTPVVKFLIITNVVVFLLQVFVVREVRVSPLEMLRKHDPRLDRMLTEAGDDPQALEALRKKNPQLDRILDENDADYSFGPSQRVSVIQEWFELDPQKVIYQGQVWRLLTHAFCHDRFGVFHILFNMLFLYWFGCTLESMYGEREFLLFYLAAAVFAGMMFVALGLFTKSMLPGIGASGAVMAVAMLYALHFPRERFSIFWTIQVEMRWLICFYVIWDLHPVLLALSGDRFHTGIAHSAHLGGLAFGFLYGRNEWRLAPLLNWVPGLPATRRPVRGRSLAARPNLRLVTDPDTERVDQLLMKIHESGRDSLTVEEQTFLQEASERIKKRRSRLR